VPDSLQQKKARLVRAFFICGVPSLASQAPGCRTTVLTRIKVRSKTQDMMAPALRSLPEPVETVRKTDALESACGFVNWSDDESASF